MVLVVYDTSGRVLYQVAGTYEPPSGIPYLEADIDPNKFYVTGVDISKEPHEPITGERENLYQGMGEVETGEPEKLGDREEAAKGVDNDGAFAQLLLNQAKIMAMLLQGDAGQGEGKNVPADNEIF